MVVTSHACGVRTRSRSTSCQRRYASCSMSSASARGPSMRYALPSKRERSARNVATRVFAIRDSACIELGQAARERRAHEIRRTDRAEPRVAAKRLFHGARIRARARGPSSVRSPRPASPPRPQDRAARRRARRRSPESRRLARAKARAPSCAMSRTRDDRARRATERACDSRRTLGHRSRISPLRASRSSTRRAETLLRGEEPIAPRRDLSL